MKIKLYEGTERFDLQGNNTYACMYFLGSGSYKPTGASGGGDSQGPTNVFFPQKEFITFDQANTAGIIGTYV